MQNVLLKCTIFLSVLSSIANFIPIVIAADDYYDYVQEVIDEDQQYYAGQEYYYEDEVTNNAGHEDYYEQQRQQEEERARQQAEAEAEAERLEQERADKIAAEREREFQAELDKMDAEQQKAAMKKKKTDAKLVRTVLKAAEQENLYSVLGVMNWNLSIPAREFDIAGYRIRLPGLTIKQTTTKDIRKAYRNRAMAVHPDKNRDGRAQEAFIAVENAASVLSDEQLRTRYDDEMQVSRLQRRQEYREVVRSVFVLVHQLVSKVFQTIYTVLGPFATPVIILAALII